MSLILTTPAALEEYRNRACYTLNEYSDKLQNMKQNLVDVDEDLFTHYSINEIVALQEDIVQIQNLLFELDVALRNTKLGIHVSLDTEIMQILFNC